MTPLQSLPYKSSIFGLPKKPSARFVWAAALPRHRLHDAVIIAYLNPPGPAIMAASVAVPLGVLARLELVVCAQKRRDYRRLFRVRQPFRVGARVFFRISSCSFLTCASRSDCIFSGSSTSSGSSSYRLLTGAPFSSGAPPLCPRSPAARRKVRRGIRRTCRRPRFRCCSWPRAPPRLAPSSRSVFRQDYVSVKSKTSFTKRSATFQNTAKVPAEAPSPASSRRASARASSCSSPSRTSPASHGGLSGPSWPSPYRRR